MERSMVSWLIWKGLITFIVQFGDIKMVLSTSNQYHIGDKGCEWRARTELWRDKLVRLSVCIWSQFNSNKIIWREGNIKISMLGSQRVIKVIFSWNLSDLSPLVTGYFSNQVIQSCRHRKKQLTSNLASWDSVERDWGGTVWTFLRTVSKWCNIHFSQVQTELIVWWCRVWTLISSVWTKPSSAQLGMSILAAGSAVELPRLESWEVGRYWVSNDLRLVVSLTWPLTWACD